jgi:hypothetical protein
MRCKALFIGMAKTRVKQVVSSVERSSSLTMGVTVCHDPGERLGELLSGCDVIFMGMTLQNGRTEQLLKTIREHRDNVPVALVYESDPSGNAFLFAKKYNCMLFSERDRHQRTIAPAEVGEELLKNSARDETERRLMDVSRSTGPCTCGD